MGRISKYKEIAAPDGDDLLIGTDVENGNETRNFTIQSIADLVSGAAGITPTLQQVTAAGNETTYGINSTGSIISTVNVPGGLGIRGYSTWEGTGEQANAGVYGESNGGSGVRGVSTDGWGVSGSSTKTAVHGQGEIGVEGYGTLFGMTATATNGTGIYAQGTQSGVNGQGEIGVEGVGTSFGIVGTSTSINTTGIYGISEQAGGTGVGGLGSTYGVYGQGGVTGIKGVGTSRGVEGSANVAGGLGVRGNSSWVGVGDAANAGVYGISERGSGVRGVCTDGWGVSGACDYGTGVNGQGEIGVEGIGTSFGMTAVSTSANGNGLYGECQQVNGTGVNGRGGTYGVYGLGIQGAGGYFETTNGDFALISSGPAGKPGGGTFLNYSDSRIKQNVSPYTKGLAEILLVNTVNFEYNGLANTKSGIEYVGIIAQDIKDIFPETINTYKAKLNEEDEEKTELYSFDASPLTFALINAVKQLSAEIELLKNK